MKTKNLLTKKQINNYQQNGVIPIYGLFKPWIKDIANGIKKLFEDGKLKEKLILNGKQKLNEIETRHEYKKIFKIIKDYRKITKTWRFDN